MSYDKSIVDNKKWIVVKVTQYMVRKSVLYFDQNVILCQYCGQTIGQTLVFVNHRNEDKFMNRISTHN